MEVLMCMVEHKSAADCMFGLSPVAYLFLRIIMMVSTKSTAQLAGYN